MNNRRGRQCAVFTLWTLSLIVFSRTLGQLLRLALHDERCSYIVVIPVITALLIYLRRNEVCRKAEYWLGGGCAALMTGVLLACVCERAADYLGSDNVLSLMVFSIVVVWAGVFCLCYGRHAAREAAFALLFLAAMIPLPTFVLDQAVTILQHGSVHGSYVLFKLLGIPVLGHGVTLSVPGADIEVARECSGIRSCIALLVTSSLAGYAFLSSGYTRVFLLVLTVPIAIVKNAVRIVTIAWLGTHVSEGFFYGPLHRKGGALFALPALACMLALAYALRSWERYWRRSNATHDTKVPSQSTMLYE